VEDQRPSVPDNMPADYRELMEECWATDMEKRPSFPQVLRRITAMWEAAHAARSTSRLAVVRPFPHSRVLLVCWGAGL
jgi:Protein tyrosine and serine/threonine kinase